MGRANYLGEEGGGGVEGLFPPVGGWQGHGRHFVKPDARAVHLHLRVTVKVGVGGVEGEWGGEG